MKRVEKFNLDDLEEKAAYEELLNDSEVIITREEFMYTKNAAAAPLITVWWVEDRTLLI
jgi:hypothetical protein